MIDEEYVCSSCGAKHPSTPFSFAADFPDRYANLSREDRDARSVIGTDQCVIDQTEFYLRGCLEIPVVGLDDPFIWGLWARVHEKDYDEVEENWEAVGRERSTGPYKGRLANSLSFYPETLNLKIEILVQQVGTRPLFIVNEESQIGNEQRQGITKEQASKYACLLLRMQRP
jgi:hypothetical protein